jgi:hypothetical protein
MIFVIETDEPFMVMDRAVREIDNRLAKYRKPLFRYVVAKPFCCV